MILPVVLDHPPLGLRDEAHALVVRVTADDLDRDVQQCAVDDDLVLEGLVHHDFLQARPAPPGHLVERGRAGGVVVCGGSRHDDTDKKPQYIGGQSPLAPRRPLVRVPSRRGLREQYFAQPLPHTGLVPVPQPPPHVMPEPKPRSCGR